MYGFVVDGKEGFDSRDIHRVQTDTEYVAKFVRQVGGDENKAYNMLVCFLCLCVCVSVYVLLCIYVYLLCTVQVEAMKWRKSFGANGMTNTMFLSKC